MDAIFRERARQMAEEMAGGVQTTEDLGEMMRMMSKTLTEPVLDAEMDVHLDRTKATGSSATEEGEPVARASSAAGQKNRRNGHSSKTVQADLGEVTIDTRRNRDGSLELQLVPKYQWRLAGFADAIHTVYEKTKVQLCVVHLVRATLRYVINKDSKAVARDLKKIYNAATLPEAETALDEFASAWDEKYPTISKSWRAKWPGIITLFDFPWPIRKAIPTTNAVESVNSVIRKLTRNRKTYPNEESVLKIMYMAIREASRKWKMPIRNRKSAFNHFAIILFEDWLPTNQS